MIRRHRSRWKRIRTRINRRKMLESCPVTKPMKCVVVLCYVTPCMYLHCSSVILCGTGTGQSALRNASKQDSVLTGRPSCISRGTVTVGSHIGSASSSPCKTQDVETFAREGWQMTFNSKNESKYAFRFCMSHWPWCGIVKSFIICAL
jgi:hypothetical protein